MTTLLADPTRLQPPVLPPESQDDVAETEVESSPVADDRELLRTAFAKEELTWRSVDPVVVAWIVGMHAGLLAAPFFFDWWAVALCVGLHWATCSIGICLGYHRYLSHRSLKLKAPAEFVSILCGVIAGEGRPLKWAATHRVHHQKSDQDGDPHSPTEGTWWSHILWLFRKQRTAEEEVLIRRYVPELAERPILRLFDDHYALWLWGAGLAIGAVGFVYGLISPDVSPWFGAASFMLWGMCVRMVFAYHSTWFVNSATHLWGYRNYETRDHSKNLWWVAILAYGEGWHNNHHAHPSIAPAGHRWWEFDPTWCAIRFLRAIGQAHDVKDRIPQSRRAADDENAGPPTESETQAA